MIGRGEKQITETRRTSTEVKPRIGDRTEVEAQKTDEAHNEVQKVVQGILSQKHQKHQQQDNDSHNVSDMKKDRDLLGRKQEIRGYKKERKFETQNTQQNARD